MPKRKTPIIVLPDGTVSFQCSSSLYGVTDAGGKAVDVLKTGWVSLGDGCDYKLKEVDKKNIQKQLKKLGL
jgi:hypothetical protein